MHGDFLTSDARCLPNDQIKDNYVILCTFPERRAYLIDSVASIVQEDVCFWVFLSHHLPELRALRVPYLDLNLHLFCTVGVILLTIDA